MTIKQIYNLLKETVTESQFIATFDFGSVFDYNQDQRKNYPQLYLEDNLRTEKKDNVKIVEFFVSFGDLIKQGDPNESKQVAYNNCLSKMDQTADLFLNLLEKKLRGLDCKLNEISKRITFSDWGTDDFAGVRLELQIEGLGSSLCEYGEVS